MKLATELNQPPDHAQALEIQAWAEREETRLAASKKRCEGDEERLSSLAVELHEREAHVTRLQGRLEADLDLAQVGMGLPKGAKGSTWA